jgi:cell wall-associated NlpC family hydrolase
MAAILSGCAGLGGTQAGSGISGYSTADWRNSADPIGSFLARSKNGAGLIAGDINHPLALQALTQLGIRYRWGGKSPETGFDCSGLVLYSAQQSLGLKLPPRSYDIAMFGIEVPRTDLKVGDLVFFNTLGRRNSHVGVYLGEDQFVHSPAAGGVVRIENMNQAYWARRFDGARRL